jgi:hypothetical protein
VRFACSGLPTAASCSFCRATVTPSLTITAPAQSAAVRPNHTPWLPVATLAACFIGWRRRGNLRLWLMLAVAAAALGCLSACGGGGSSGGGVGGGGGSTPVTSTVTVTATSGSLQQTANISLTVN